jgi:dTDP-4-dehydrorhamnose reductase
LNNPIIIYGKNGQIGSALAHILGNQAIVIASNDADFSVYENIVLKLKGISPKAIINATAYTNVDLAETEQQAAYKANVEIPAALTKYAKEMDIPLVHYSTDYVFSGEGSTPQTEDEPTSPINVYGKTKLEGEKAIARIGGKYLIFRTSWVYDETHKNFLTTMLRLGKEREELSIVSDQIGAPTYAHDLAVATLEALNNLLKPAASLRGAREAVDVAIHPSGLMDCHAPLAMTASDKFTSGIYHLCNGGETSWSEYAKVIFEIAKNKNIPLLVKKITPIFSEQYLTPAKRPLNSRLNCEKAKSVLKAELPDWRTSLEKCMEKIV